LVAKEEGMHRGELPASATPVNSNTERRGFLHSTKRKEREGMKEYLIWHATGNKMRLRRWFGRKKRKSGEN